MKHLLLLFLAVSPLAAQQVEPGLRMDRPSFATTGKEIMPMMNIDEQVLSPDRFMQIPFPPQRWTEEMACLMNMGVDVSGVGLPPAILVVPTVRTIRVNDMTVDSMVYAEDSTFVGEVWSDPTVGYSLVRSGYILATAEYQKNPYLLRHEALHFMLWRLGLAPELGHPKKFFDACDVNYDPR